jgi:hypothetical protein
MFYRRLLPLFLLCIAPFVAWPTPSFAESSLSAGTVSPSPSSVLQEVDALLAGGNFEAAELLLSEGLRGFGTGISSADRFTLHYALALVRVRLPRAESAILSFVEAIALADGLEASGQPDYEGLALSVRLELASFLLELGRPADSEALCWDALGLSLAKTESKGLGPVVVALVSAVLAQPADDADLLSFLAELDAELTRWDGYRLSLPPPPEPIFALLEEGAARLLAEGSTTRASALFTAILRLDRVRSADWRLVADLSAVAFSALLIDDLASARDALAEVTSLLRGQPFPIDVWANRCYLAAFEGALAQADVECLGGIAAARSAGDEQRAVALTSVLAGLRRLGGDRRGAVNLYEDAGQRYDQLGAASAASAERAEAIASLVEERHLDEALRLLQRLDQRWQGEPVHARIEESRQRLALQMLLSSFDSSDDEEIRMTLQNLGAHLFSTGRAIDLSELSLLYLDLVLRSDSLGETNSEPQDGEGLEAAVEAIVRLEDELGLGSAGWVGLQARALVALSQGEEEVAVGLLSEALTPHEERLLSSALSADPLRVWIGRGLSPFYSRPKLEPHNTLLPLLRGLGRERDAADLEARVERVNRALLWRQPAAAEVLRPRDSSERLFLKIRAERVTLEAHLVMVSLHGGDVPPAEVRAAVTPLLTQVRKKEDTAFSAIQGRRKALFRPGVGVRLGDPGPSAPLEKPGEPVLWTDLSSAECSLGRPGSAAIFLETSASERLGPGAISGRTWSGLILLPICESSEGATISSSRSVQSLGLQDEAFFLGGASGLVRQVRPAPRRARRLFRQTLADRLQEGRSASEAFEAAVAAVAVRFRKERVRTAWELRSP